MNTPLTPVAISPVEDIVADMRAGRIVILVDEEDRENEGDLVLAADHVTPEAINFMARFGRGLICLTLTRERCERLRLPPMVSRNGTKHSTAFTVSIEAAEGVTTGISAADRARTVQAAVAPNARAEDLVQPGHIFPLQAVDGGVLMRAGHTEAGCDLAAMAGCSPSAVICEIMKDDGTMARLPDLQLFAAEHGLKIGTIADLIGHRSRTESLVQKVGSRTLNTAFGEFTAHAFRDLPSQAVHLALVKGTWDAGATVPVRVHEPLSVLDALEAGRSMHSWSLDASLQYLQSQGQGVAVLLNCGESAEQLLEQFAGTARASQAPERGRMDLRTYGVGAQILRDCGVQRMQLMGQPRRMPSMAGYGLEIIGYIPRPAAGRRAAPLLFAAPPGPPHPTGHPMFGADKGTADKLDGKKLHIGIVQARFNESITDALAQACRDELRALGVQDKHITHVKVPGALEVPVALQAMAERDEFDALIALGCIIRGETYHFELVANESGAGVTRIGLDYQLPVANAILTTENVEQAVARQTDKGRDAARVAVEMANLLDELS